MEGLKIILIILLSCLFTIGLMMIFEKLEKVIVNFFDKFDTQKIAGVALCIISLIIWYNVFFK